MAGSTREERGRLDPDFLLGREAETRMELADEIASQAKLELKIVRSGNEKRSFPGM